MQHARVWLGLSVFLGVLIAAWLLWSLRTKTAQVELLNNEITLLPEVYPNTSATTSQITESAAMATAEIIPTTIAMTAEITTPTPTPTTTTKSNKFNGALDQMRKFLLGPVFRSLSHELTVKTVQSSSQEPAITLPGKQAYLKLDGYLDSFVLPLWQCRATIEGTLPPKKPAQCNPSGGARKAENVVRPANLSMITLEAHHAKWYLSDGLPDLSRIKTVFSGHSILLLGCSLDRHVVEWFCQESDLEITHHLTENFRGSESPLLYVCNASNFLLFHVFFPGAAPCYPYFKHYVRETPMRLSNASRWISSLYGIHPTLVVVDSSLWEITRWWRVDRQPDHVCKFPKMELVQWCDHELAKLLDWVGIAFPFSTILFRTAPITQGCWRYLQRLAIFAMTDCVWAQSREGKLFGKYGLVPFHEIFNLVLTTTSKRYRADRHGPQWADNIHVGHFASQLYLSIVFSELAQVLSCSRA